MGKTQAGAGGDGGPHQPECCGTDVPGNVNLLAPQGPARGEPHMATVVTVHLHVRPERLQHAFAVIPGAVGFNDGHTTAGRQPRQQQRGFHLGRRHGGADYAPLKLAAADPQGSKGAVGPPVNAGAHGLAEGVADPSHGPLPQGTIAGEHKVAPFAARQQTQQQPHRGAGVATVQHIDRLLQTVQPHTLHHNGLIPVLQGTDGHTHGPQTLGRATGIFRRQHPVNAGVSLCNGANQQGSVGNGFIPRNHHFTP